MIQIYRPSRYARIWEIRLKTRTLLLRLQEKREIFEDWNKLQEWLLEGYSVEDVGLDAELKMERVRMR